MDYGSKVISNIKPYRSLAKKEHMSDQSYTNGEYIFREGESAAFAYVIKSGTVEITKHSTEGEQILAELTAPTIFGEMALIDGNPRSAGARAKINTLVTEVTAEAFVNYLSQNPDNNQLKVLKILGFQIN